jgi:hypothetical protein
MFIKKIFENKTNESVHKQFVRFGKGTFGMRAVINARISGQVKVSSTFELANDFLEFIASLSPKMKVSGIILSKEKLGLENERKKTGLFEYSIEREMGSEEMKKILDKCYFALLDCSAQGIELRVKKKLPKPGKSGESKVNDKFCVLDLDLKFLAKFKDEFFWDINDFKKARAEHTFIITDIIMPAGEKDFEKIRQEAKRKGKIIRKVIVDGKEIVKEKEFSV